MIYLQWEIPSSSSFNLVIRSPPPEVLMSIISSSGDVANPLVSVLLPFAYCKKIRKTIMVLLNNSFLNRTIFHLLYTIKTVPLNFVNALAITFKVLSVVDERSYYMRGKQRSIHTTALSNPWLHIFGW